MSEMSARASRRAFCFGSCTINGLTGRNGPVLRLPGMLAPAAGGGAGALGADMTGAGGGAGRGAGRGDGGAGGAGGAGGRGGIGVGADATGRGAAAAAPAPSGLTAKTLLQTLQRARRPRAGTFAGSTRYTVSHDGQVTFTS